MRIKTNTRIIENTDKSVTTLIVTDYQQTKQPTFTPIIKQTDFHKYILMDQFNRLKAIYRLTFPENTKMKMVVTTYDN